MRRGIKGSYIVALSRAYDEVDVLKTALRIEISTRKTVEARLDTRVKLSGEMIARLSRDLEDLAEHNAYLKRELAEYVGIYRATLDKLFEERVSRGTMGVGGEEMVGTDEET